MKLEEKRKVIETLLCSVNSWGGCLYHAREIGHSDVVGVAASMEWVRTHRHTRYVRGIDAVAIEAAYRLIATSVTLQREWFGR